MSKLDRRDFLLTGGALAAGMAAAPSTLSGANATAAASVDEMKIQRLTWSGIRIEVGEQALFMEPQTIFRKRPELGVSIVPVHSDAPSRFVAITHTHPDHFDPETIRGVLSEDGAVLCHEDIASWVSSRGIPTISLHLWEPYALAGFIENDITVCCVPAQDGYGDPQVSWIVSGGGKRIIHCGDTMWHGQWRKIGRQYGPFDAAFLPINGVFQPTEIFPVSKEPLSMTPQQAVRAAKLLNAKLLVPIHYGRKPTATYVEIEQPEAHLVKEAKEERQAVKIIAPAEWLNWPE